MSVSWAICPHDDKELQEAVVQVHQQLYKDIFRDDFGINHDLPILIRAFRRSDDWRVMIVLTPWMLARLYFPDNDPGLDLPEDWSIEARENTAYRVLGPSYALGFLGGRQKAHLNYDVRLGHYLLQPLALCMDQYSSPEDVFAAWNEVIETRDENIEKAQADCQWQKEISRRELFRR